MFLCLYNQEDIGSSSALSVLVSNCFGLASRCGVSLKWKKQKYLWEGSVSLVALLLSHMLHTSMEILNCPWIMDREGNYLPVSVRVL